MKHDYTQRPVPGKATKVVNGKPYYPSVEEVMALLHADRTDVIEELNSSDGQPHDQRDHAVKPIDAAAEQLEQERLRNEVVGRVEPKMAFIDEAGDISTDVLPTTIRRNSVSSSISSIDSLDSVPDDELESMPACTGNPIVGIIRKGKKGKRNSRVTFNENVAFSDGVVGTLKRKPGVGQTKDSSIMPKQTSFYELSDNKEIGHDSKTSMNGTVVEDSLIKNHYLSKQSKPNNSTTSGHDCSYVSAYDVGAIGVMTYSTANNQSRHSVVNSARIANQNAGCYSGKNHSNVSKHTSKFNVSSNDSKRDVLNNNTNYVGHADPAISTQTCTSTKNSSRNMETWKNTDSTHKEGNEDDLNNNAKTFDYVKRAYSSSEHDQALKMNKSSPAIKGGNYLGSTNQSGFSNTGGAQRLNAFEVISDVKNMSHACVNGIVSVSKHSNENEKLSSQFSSINASMLKDSLEMHNDIRRSHDDSSVGNKTQEHRTIAQAPKEESKSSGYITKHNEIPPETPLVPVTKRDFLSKALRSDKTDENIQNIADHSRYHGSHEGVILNGRNESNSTRHEERGLNGNFNLYDQEQEFIRSRQMNSEQNGHARTLENSFDNGRPAQGGDYITRYNDSYSQRNILQSGSAMADNIALSANSDTFSAYDTKQKTRDGSYSQTNTINNREMRENAGPSTANAATSYYSSSLNQGNQHVSRDKQGMSRHDRMNRDTSSAIPTKSKVPTEKFNSIQNTLRTTNVPPYRQALRNGEHKQASKKPSSADDLLKSVQADIERLSMTPNQQGVTRTIVSAVKLSETNHAGSVPGEFGSSGNGRSPKHSDKSHTSPSFENRSKSTNNGRGRSLTNVKATSHGQKSKLGETNKADGNYKRFQTSGSDPGMINSKSEAKAKYVQSHNNETYTNAENQVLTNGGRVQSAHGNHVYTISNHGKRPTYPNNIRGVYGKPSESSGVHSQGNIFERKQRLNRQGLGFLDKTPTDEEINHLWETVRTCLKHEQPQKAASDTVVNNIRYSRSDSGPGNHYLIDSSAWTSKPGIESDNGSRGSLRSHFRRQGSLDSLQRRGSSENTGYVPLRKGSLLQHRSSTSDRRLPVRNSPAGRPPVNSQYIQSLRGPVTSARGPVKSNTAKMEGRSQLSYAELQAIMQASADIKTRKTEQNTHKGSRQSTHQPIIMDYRKGTFELFVYFKGHLRDAVSCIPFAS